ncbi:MAG: type IV pilus modification PilV family protein [Geminicoccaceae bacterium]
MAALTSRRGFTLLEVLVALIIFAISFGAIASIFQTSLRQSITASKLLDAKALAEQQMARLGVELPLELGKHNGVAATASGSTMIWQSRIDLAEPVDDQDPVALYHITVDVGDEDDDRPIVTLQTFRIGEVR